MGTDKGLLKTNSETWAREAAAKLVALSIPVVLSVNSGQEKLYKEAFLEDQLVLDHPSIQLKGPIAGVLSVHIHFPNQDLLVLACDMPQMKSSLMQGLIDFQLKNPQYGAYIYFNEENPEPLCGIYTAKALQSILGLYHNSELKKNSMKYLLEQIKTFSAPISKKDLACFKNFNSHACLNGE